MTDTCAIVNITVSDNATVQNAFQLGTVGDTSWSLTGMTFRMEIKASRDDVSPLVTWTTGGGQIVTLDAVQRIVQLNVPYTVVQASLPPATYVYDFLMLDGSVPAIRTLLMQGTFEVQRGVTED